MKGPVGVPGEYLRPDGVIVPPELAHAVLGALVLHTSARKATGDPALRALAQALADAVRGQLPSPEVTEVVAIDSVQIETTGQAAARLKITDRAVRNRCAAGTLPAIRHGRSWLVVNPPGDTS